LIYTYTGVLQARIERVANEASADLEIFQKKSRESQSLFSGLRKIKYVINRVAKQNNDLCEATSFSGSLSAFLNLEARYPNFKKAERDPGPHGANVASNFIITVPKYDCV
jgi:hypothetical protein